jgi:uncharacterized protein YbjT (DUF2867 family)
VRLVILGATGGTGRLLVEGALERGHEVVAYVRRPEALTERSGLLVVGGQLTDQPALTSAITGADGVLCAIGPASVRDLIGPDLMRRTLATLAGAMTSAGVRRLVLLSAYGVGDTAVSASTVQRLAFGTAVRSLYRDKVIAEQRLAEAGLEITTVYPMMLTDGPARDDDVVLDVTAVSRVSGLPRVSRATVARAMLDAAEDPGAIGRRLVVSSAGTVR